MPSSPIHSVSVDSQPYAASVPRCSAANERHPRAKREATRSPSAPIAAMRISAVGGLISITSTAEGEDGGPALRRSSAQSLLRINRGPREISPKAPISRGFQKRKKRCRIVSITSSSPRAEPPGKRWKKVSTASAALSYLITASQPSKFPVSGSDDHLPSLSVARHLPPHGPRTSMP